VKVLATGSTLVDPAIKDFDGPEKFDTASVVVRFENGKDAIIDVCRKAVYGYDQRAEVLGQDGMVMSENVQPSTVRKFTAGFVGQADMPYDFFMSRYKEAYVAETEAFVEALVNDKPAPCSGRDGLVALVMAMAAGVSAEEERWVDFGEIIRRENLAEGEFGDFGSLLDSEGKLKGNWVRAALLSIDRDPNSQSDLKEVWSLLDVEGTDAFDKLKVAEVLQKFGRASSVTVDVDDFFPADASSMCFDEFLAGWKELGYEPKQEGLKKDFQLL